MNSLITSRRKLGRTSVEIPSVGFGGAPLGNLFQPISDDTARSTLTAAYDIGLRYFDTSPLYGYGLSEQRLGEFFRDKPRHEYILSTKVGRILVPNSSGESGGDGYVHTLPFKPVFDYSYDGTMRSFEDSLQRLGTDYIDILLIHDIDARTHGINWKKKFDEAMRGSYRGLEKLRSKGVIGAIGIGVNDCETCIEAMQFGDFDCFLLAGRYSLLDQQAIEVLLPVCKRRGISVIIGGVFNSGVLATGSNGTPYYDYATASASVLDHVKRLERVCTEFSVPLAAAAIQFPFGSPQVVSVVVGVRSPEELEANRKSIETPIPATFWRRLRAEGLIDAASPDPNWPQL